MGYLAFYKGKGDFLNKVVRFFTRSKYSHCAIVVHGVEYSSSSRYGGVYATRWDILYDINEWDFINLADIPAQDIVAFYNRTRDCKYDYLGALDIITMEYNELKKAHDTNNAKDYEENLYHLATACLNAWRIEHHDE